jgi:hypothetical protein
MQQLVNNTRIYFVEQHKAVRQVRKFERTVKKLQADAEEMSLLSE